MGQGFSVIETLDKSEKNEIRAKIKPVFSWNLNEIHKKWSKLQEKKIDQQTRSTIYSL